MPVYSIMLVVCVFFLLNTLMDRGEPAIAPGSGAIRFYYAVRGDETRLEHADITFTAGSASSLVETLEEGFKKPPAGKNFVPAIGSDVSVNKVVSYENTVEIDFGSHPFSYTAGAEGQAAVNAVAYTLFGMYGAEKVVITVDGNVLRTVEK